MLTSSLVLLTLGEKIKKLKKINFIAGPPELGRHYGEFCEDVSTDLVQC